MRRAWTNPAHRRTPFTVIVVIGGLLGFGSMAVGEALLAGACADPACAHSLPGGRR